MSASNLFIPYTYRIGWTKHNKWYYGARWAQGCNPDELWKTYFTSSKHVAHFAAKYGNPDVIEIRKTFPEQPNKARIWEANVLKRLDLKSNKQYLNATNNEGIPYVKFDRAENFKEYIDEIKGLTYEERHGKVKAEELRQVRREYAKKNGFGKQWKGKPKTESHKRNIAKSVTGHARLKGYIWVNDGVVERMMVTMPEGWNRGRLPKVT